MKENPLQYRVRGTPVPTTQTRGTNYPKSTLVPKEWTGKGLELYGRRYYNCQALGYIQQKLQVNNPRSGKVAKKTLEKQYPETYPINRKTTLEAFEKGEDLLKKFIVYVDKKAKNKTDLTISGSVASS